MPRFLVSIAIAVCGCAAVPAQAAESADLSYTDAMSCSALYTYLGASVEGESEEPVLLDIAARWLVLAMFRDGTDDGLLAEAELETTVEALLAELVGFNNDEAAIRDWLDDGVQWCEATQQTVAEEFASAADL